MRIKRDYMGNDQLLPAYNLQSGICDEYIAVANINQYASDMDCFIPLMIKYHKQYGFYSKYPVADAGYDYMNIFCKEHNMEDLYNGEIEACEKIEISSKLPSLHLGDLYVKKFSSSELFMMPQYNYPSTYCFFDLNEEKFQSKPIIPFRTSINIFSKSHSISSGFNCYLAFTTGF